MTLLLADYGENKQNLHFINAIFPFAHSNSGAKGFASASAVGYHYH